MSIIRAFRPDDLPALYEISLATGHEGRDASHLYSDPDMMGHIYAAPYVVLEPSLALVAQDTMGVAGFVVGAIDTAKWEDLLEKAWWPHLRLRYSDPPEAVRASWSPDERRVAMIHHPSRTPQCVTMGYPAHLHMNLLPRVQGTGLGTKLFHEWRSLLATLGVEGMHIGANRANELAIRFWARNGFKEIDSKGITSSRTIWMGLSPR